jgi:hypothetical protein
MLEWQKLIVSHWSLVVPQLVRQHFVFGQRLTTNDQQRIPEIF